MGNLLSDSERTVDINKLDKQPEGELSNYERSLIGKTYTCWGLLYKLVGFRKDDGPWLVETTGKELPRTVSMRAIGGAFREVLESTDVSLNGLEVLRKLIPDRGLRLGVIRVICQENWSSLATLDWILDAGSRSPTNEELAAIRNWVESL